MDRNGRYFIEALHRGLSVLEVFSQNSSALSLAEISAKVELDKSTVFRFVYTLEQLGYLERDKDTKQYRPGLEVLKLGFTALNSLDIVQLARPYLEALQQEMNESVNMAIRDGANIVYIARFTPAQIVNINLQVGSRLPVHCTSMGKALLVDLSQNDLRELLGPGPYEAFTPNTITTLDDLVADVAQVRERDFAISDEELTIGVRSAAALIRRSNEDIVASINVSALSTHISHEKLVERMAPSVVRTAKRISSALGAIS
jgi:PcaR/PcaU/PobR family beta-ketoadipate pathway transcriptional regulator